MFIYNAYSSSHKSIVRIVCYSTVITKLGNRHFQGGEYLSQNWFAFSSDILKKFNNVLIINVYVNYKVKFDFINFQNYKNS